MSPEGQHANSLESPFNRFVGAAIDDGLWLAATFLVLSYVPASVYDDHPEAVGIVLVVLASLWLNYFAFCESKWGKTIGKHVMGMKVLGGDGATASFGACSIRNLLRPLDYLVIGPVMIASTPRHQRLGDRIGDTIVVSERPPTTPAATVTAMAEEEDLSPLTDREHVRLPERRGRQMGAPSSRGSGSRGQDSGYASAGRRTLAFLLDALLLLFAATVIFALPGTGFYDDHPAAAGLIFFAVATAAFNYFAVSEWKWGGRTIGKKALGIRVTGEDGETPGFGAASMRNLLRLIDVFFIGPILILGSERKQRLGDLAAHTVVVRGERAPAELEVEPEPQPAAAGQPVPPGAPAKGAVGLPEITWDLRHTIWGLLAGLFLAAFVAPLLILPFDSDISSLGATLAAQTLLTVALIGTALFVARQKALGGGFDLRATLDRLGWRRFRRSAIGQLVLTLVLYYIAAALVSIVLKPDQEDIGSELGLDRGILLASVAVFLICIVAPIAEETFFRGFFFAGLRGRLSRIPSALISGIVFGAVHAPTGPTAVIPLAIFGTGLALLYERTGSIWPGIIAHAINNSLALLVAS